MSRRASSRGLAVGVIATGGAALFGLVVAAAGDSARVTEPRAEDGALRDAGAAPGSATILSAGGPAGGAAIRTPQAPESIPPEPSALDCARPEGTVARVGARTISARDLCRAGAALLGAGAEAERLSEVLERLVEVTLVEQALGVGSEGDRPIDLADPAAQRLHRERLEALVDRDPALRIGESEVLSALNEQSADPMADTDAEILAWLWRVPAGDHPEVEREARARAQRWSHLLTEQADASAPEGGVSTRLTLVRNGLEPELERVAFGLSPGRWSEPVRTRAGWVVLRVEAFRDRPWATPDERRAAIARRLASEARTDVRRRLLAELRSEAEVAILVLLSREQREGVNP